MFERIGASLMAAVSTWRGWNGDDASAPASRDDWYRFLWSFVDGSAFTGAWQRQGVFRDARVYRNTRLIYQHVSSVVDFYRANVYQGSLSTDGTLLPDGSPGAIPLDPQTGTSAGDAALRTAVSALWDRWRWQQHMSLRPMYASALGSALTELIDDPAHHATWPQLIWPGYVVDLTLSPVGDLTAYTLEYPVTIERNGAETTGLYRKEVDKGGLRHFFEDKPWSDPDRHGDAEQENPYGFVPAVWDRHKLVASDHGLSAFADTVQALMELNSLLSHGKDYQHKAFRAPVGVRGWTGAAAPVVGPDRSADPAKLAESMGFIPLGADGGIEQLSFDVGQTLAMLDWIKAGILDANPEASFYHQLREMSQLTGPAVERALGDATSRVTLARAGYDPQSVKLFQMAISMCAYRYRDRGENGWARRGGPTTKRDAVFAPYDLASYVDGALDMTILPRPLVPETPEERIALLLQREALETPTSLVELGFPRRPVLDDEGKPVEVDVTAELLLEEKAAARERAQAMAARAFNAGAVPPVDDDEEDLVR